MPPKSTSLASRKPEAKSRVTNGSDVLPNVDGRTALARRYRDIACALVADAGGEDKCSETKIQLIRRFSAAAVLAESMEARLANGEQINIGEHALLSSTLVRIAQRIGINRLPKNLTPDLQDYIARRVGAKDELAA
jgi:hypothetical protein